MVGIFFLIAAGLILLTVGAELLVRGSSKLALYLKVPALVVGLTVVAFGTSAPELVVSVSSGLRGLGDIAVGNVVGSNLFNIALILGVAALIRPLKVNLKVLRIDMPIVIAASILVPVLLADGTISRFEGIALFCCVIGYTVFTVMYGKKEAGAFQSPADQNVLKGSISVQIIVILAGLCALVLGSKFFVDGAVDLATRLRVSEAVIGLTVIAAGTSLPELATSIAAAIRKQEDIAIGNILGSNIFNVFAILGVTGSITPLHVRTINSIDLGAMIVSALFLLPLMRTGFRITRLEGAGLLVFYGVYLFYRWP